MTTAIDTNALLAILYGGEYTEASEAAIRSAYEAGPLVVTAPVYAELAADGHFEGTTELDRFLEDFSIDVVEPSRAAFFRAGTTFREYVERRPDGLQCPSCGARTTVDCDECGASLTPRQHVASDFLIGGHAAEDASALVSFDAAFYETYFPSLAVRPA